MDYIHIITMALEVVRSIRNTRSLLVLFILKPMLIQSQNLHVPQLHWT